MTEETNQSYPLDWPAGWQRTLAGNRRRAPFYKTRRVTYANSTNTYQKKETLTVGDGLERLNNEIRRLRVTRVVISSNLYLRQDGIPHAGQRKVLDDPGVAVYFVLKGRAMALACDRW